MHARAAAGGSHGAGRVREHGSLPAWVGIAREGIAAQLGQVAGEIVDRAVEKGQRVESTRAEGLRARFGGDPFSNIDFIAKQLGRMNELTGHAAETAKVD